MIVKTRLTYLNGFKVKNELNVKDGKITDLNNLDNHIITNTFYVKNINDSIGKTQATLCNFNPNKPVLSGFSNLVVKENKEDKLFLTSVTSLKSTIDVKMDYTIYLKPSVNGLQDFSINAVSGHSLTVKLNTSEVSLIKQVKGLPSSLYYDADSEMIKGTPLVLGDFVITVVLKNKSEVLINLKVSSENETKTV
ncbi:hypothetical protein Goe21_02080 [Bacillus phage vB_BsuM-Goe21]|nr:hypothetical protein Goe21_02080 [Bacillus phage vB_BsuM-Goe21]